MLVSRDTLGRLEACLGKLRALRAGLMGGGSGGGRGQGQGQQGEGDDA